MVRLECPQCTYWPCRCLERAEAEPLSREELTLGGKCCGDCVPRLVLVDLLRDSKRLKRLLNQRGRDAADAEDARDRAEAALRGLANAYGCFAGCTGALPGAPADGSGHTPACQAARAVLEEAE